MFELNQLKQLIAVAKHGTLSKAAEELNLTQPALTRSMQRLEGELSVTLFERGKNRIVLNDNGVLTVELARKLIDDANEMTNRIRQYDRRKRTISIASCAPAPLWTLSPEISAVYPQMTIATEISEDTDALIKGLNEGLYQIIILNGKPDITGAVSFKYSEETLYFHLPKSHRLAKEKFLSFSDLNGETMLLRSSIGFWSRICEEKLPDTHFMIQEDAFEFNELVKASAIPSFSTDLALAHYDESSDRVLIPISDPEAHAEFYIVCRKDGRERLKEFLRMKKSGPQP